MRALNRLKDGIQNVQIMLGLVLIIIFFATILLQIFSRIAGISMTWTEDVSKFSFIWAVFLGSSWAVARDEHFAFTMVLERFNNRNKGILKIIIYLLCMIFTISILYYGIVVTKQFWNYAWPNIPELKMGWVWLILPLTGLTMTFYLIINILNQICIIKNGGSN